MTLVRAFLGLEGRGQPGTEALLGDLGSDTDDSDFDPVGAEELETLVHDREADLEMALMRENGELADEDELMVEDAEEESEDGTEMHAGNGNVQDISSTDDEDEVVEDDGRTVITMPLAEDNTLRRLFGQALTLRP